MIPAAVTIVTGGLKEATSATHRVRPLVFSRLARGGKTTALFLLFDKLKEANLNPIFISFNGSTQFQRRVGETDCQAILRSIALQLVDLGDRNPLNITCDQKKLEAYLTESSKPVVLIIDELNALQVPVDAEAGRMLRSLFLDKKDRFLVFSTHVPLDVETTASETHRADLLIASLAASPRGVILAPMPSCFDLPTLRAMSPACVDLNPAEVAYYGGVPSLIYSVRLGELTPKTRFTNVISTTVHDVDALEAFVKCVVTGARNSLLARFDQFGTVSDSQIRWPLCYIECIHDVMPQTNATRFLQQCFGNLKSRIGTTETGLEWESILQIALAFRCLHQSLIGTKSPFEMYDTVVKPCSLFVTMPGECKTIGDALSWISVRIAEGLTEADHVLLLVVPSYGKFPDVDGFVATGKKLQGKSSVRVCAYQAKSGRALPKNPLPERSPLNRGYLLRGIAAQRRSFHRGWEYVDESGVQELLGHSLSPLYPQKWPHLPDAPDVAGADGFD